MYPQAGQRQTVNQQQTSRDNCGENMLGPTSTARETPDIGLADNRIQNGYHQSSHEPRYAVTANDRPPSDRHASRSQGGGHYDNRQASNERQSRDYRQPGSSVNVTDDRAGSHSIQHRTHAAPDTHQQSHYRNPPYMAEARNDGDRREGHKQVMNERGYAGEQRQATREQTSGEAVNASAYTHQQRRPPQGQPGYEQYSTDARPHNNREVSTRQRGDGQRIVAPTHANESRDRGYTSANQKRAAPQAPAGGQQPPAGNPQTPADQPQAPPRRSSKNVTQKYDASSSHRHGYPQENSHTNTPQPQQAPARVDPQMARAAPAAAAADYRGHPHQSIGKSPRRHDVPPSPSGVAEQPHNRSTSQPSSGMVDTAHRSNDASSQHSRPRANHDDTQRINRTQGVTNQAYMPDNHHERSRDTRTDDRYNVRYDAKTQSTAVGPRAGSNDHHRTAQGGATDAFRDRYQSSTAINMTSQQGVQSNDPLQNKYALPPNTTMSASNKYNSTSALHATSNEGQVTSAQRHNATGAPVSGGYHGTANGDLPSYADATGMKQAYSLHELNARALEHRPTPASPAGHHPGTHTSDHTRSANSHTPHGGSQPAHNAERRRFQKRQPAAGQAPQSQQQPPRATKRGRILSQHDQQHQIQQQPAGNNSQQQQAGHFNSAPPMRAQSVSDIRVSLNADPSAQNGGVPQTTNLHRPRSVPNVSGAGLSPSMRASTTSLNQNGHTMGGMWRSKSLLELAIESEGTNLRRSTSVTSLVLANPQLARTISTYQLYDAEISQGNVPKDHYTTLILAIIATCLFPFTGVVVLVFTSKELKLIFYCCSFTSAA